MFKTSFSTTIGLLLLLMLCHAAPVGAQPPFQQRVTATCAPGSSIRVINADGSVVCEVDDNSGGTVTSVGTGSGLTGGPITTSGTISIATGGVTSAHIADGTVGAVDVNSGQIQLRVTGNCATGSAIRVVDQGGTVTCQSVGSGTVTAVTASAPLVSSGGTTPNISLPNVIIGATNTAIGSSALQSNTTGFFNTASGASALRSNTTGNSNTASGGGALQSNTTGTQNTASGVSALFSSTTGTQNTASGAFALLSNTTGDFNTASGAGALQSNTTGFSNTASGTFALQSNTTGGINTASGLGALQFNTTGNSNTASGGGALQSNTTGDSNTANGSVALFNNTTGGFNTASGLAALSSNTTGDFNTASGTFALQSNTTGSNNTAIGFLANVAAANLSNATAIGALAFVDASNKIRLGDTNVTVIEGEVPFTFSSDQTRKENFQSVNGEEVLRKLRGLSLTSWNYVGHDPKQFRHYGPMGQEFFAAFGHDGIGTIGSPTTLTSSDMAGVLMSAVQALAKHRAEQRQDIDALIAENAELKARLERLERKLTGYAMK